VLFEVRFEFSLQWLGEFWQALFDQPFRFDRITEGSHLMEKVSCFSGRLLGEGFEDFSQVFEIRVLGIADEWADQPEDDRCILKVLRLQALSQPRQTNRD